MAQPVSVDQLPQEFASDNEFSYRPLSPLAPITLVLGLLSVIGLLSEYAMIVPLVGTILGAICLVKVRRARGELGGKALALVGFVLSLLILVGGSAYHAYAFGTEVPEGYQRVNFYYDISKKGFAYDQGVEKIHPDVQALGGKKIFIKGFMYPTRQTDGIKDFILVKDSNKCCFGGQPQLSDMILVHMKEGLTAVYRQGMVSVAGQFKLRDLSAAGQLQPTYEIEAVHFESSRTAF